MSRNSSIKLDVPATVHKNLLKCFKNIGWQVYKEQIEEVTKQVMKLIQYRVEMLTTEEFLAQFLVSTLKCATCNQVPKRGFSCPQCKDTYC